MTVIAGKYEVVSELGEGSTGKVYRVRHVDIGVEYALKVLNHCFSTDERAIRRFKQEATVLGSFSHPGSIKLRDFGRTDEGLYYMCTDYCKGVPLSSLISEHGPFSPEKVLFIMDQILDVIDGAHRFGMIHRDIKPDNIMVERDENGLEAIKILDFGIAKLRESLELAGTATVEGASIGTPQYMSPEQAAGEAILDHRIDIYSAGVVMYELLAGEVPFKGETIIQTLLMHLTQTPPPFDPERGIWLFVSDVVCKALEKNPDDRFQSAAEFRVAIQTAGERIRKADKQTWVIENEEDKDQKREEQKVYVPADAEDEGPIKILCLDDNTMILDILAHILTKEGYEVYTATDSTTIHSYIFQERVKLLISDVIMPGLKGTKVCEMLKQSMRHLKIILFSNLPERELAQLSEESNADAWISKNTKPEEWLKCIREVLAREEVS